METFKLDIIKDKLTIHPACVDVYRLIVDQIHLRPNLFTELRTNWRQQAKSPVQVVRNDKGQFQIAGGFLYAHAASLDDPKKLNAVEVIPPSKKSLNTNAWLELFLLTQSDYLVKNTGLASLRFIINTHAPTKLVSSYFKTTTVSITELAKHSGCTREHIKYQIKTFNNQASLKQEANFNGQLQMDKVK